jgi:hypothetical protein
MVFPNLVFAVPTINNESQCNETTLLTADGGANLRAEWTPNTIRLQWDAGDNATFTDPTENDASY